MPSRQSLDGKSPVLHKLESAGIGHRAPSLRQAPGTWEEEMEGPQGITLLQSLLGTWPQRSSLFHCCPLQIIFHIQTACHCPTWNPSSTWSPSLSSHLTILLLFSNLFLFLKHTKPSVISGTLHTLPSFPLEGSYVSFSHGCSRSSFRSLNSLLKVAIVLWTCLPISYLSISLGCEHQEGRNCISALSSYSPSPAHSIVPGTC